MLSGPDPFASASRQERRSRSSHDMPPGCRGWEPQCRQPKNPIAGLDRQSLLQGGRGRSCKHILIRLGAVKLLCAASRRASSRTHTRDLRRDARQAAWNVGPRLASNLLIASTMASAAGRSGATSGPPWFANVSAAFRACEEPQKVPAWTPNWRPYGERRLSLLYVAGQVLTAAAWYIEM